MRRRREHVSIRGRAILAAAALAVSFAQGATGQEYDFMDLGTLGGDETRANDLNEFGIVVGSSEWKAPWGKRIETHAFWWKKGVMFDLGTLGGPWSEARSVNLLGDIVGCSRTADGAMHAFLARDGFMTDLNDLLELDPFAPGLPVLVQAASINESGHIAACGYIGAMDNVHGFLLVPTVQSDSLRMMRFEAIELGRLPGAGACAPMGLSTYDEVVGFSGGAAFIWDAGRMDPLELVVPVSQANAINSYGVAAGWCLSPDGPLAAIWLNQVRRDLETPGGFISGANDLNCGWSIVGWATPAPDGADAEPHAMLWRTIGEAIDLNDVTPFIDPGDPKKAVYLSVANAIDDRDRIVGNWVDANGDVRGFLLIPIDGPDGSFDPGYDPGSFDPGSFGPKGG